MGRRYATLGFVVGSVALLALAMMLMTAPVAAGTAHIESELPLLDDFEDGPPAGWFQYGDYGSGTVIVTTPVVTDTRPGGVPTTTLLSIAYTSAG